MISSFVACDTVCSVHWLVINIPKGADGNGQTVLEYKAPAPPQGTGYHRYMFLLFAQAGDTIQVGAFSVAKFPVRLLLLPLGQLSCTGVCVHACSSKLDTQGVSLCMYRCAVCLQVKPPASRGKFDVDKFADHYKLGSAIADFYFLAEYEDSLAIENLLNLTQ